MLLHHTCFPAKMAVAALIVGLTTPLLAACDDEGPAEQLGENIDETADQVGQSLDDAAENMEEKMENTGEAMQPQGN